ncbi:eb429a89-f91f-43bd-9caa-39ab242b97d5 [Thermothielavioides terrestris]|uniref:Eb429a89-f91f-43bd-9caa-39ab242b97d5 n=1 Tax=Thermothielavioides terrestris TaxID=2587410 RepID=A0A3S4EU48_9PEZI|nr:eb429a89-f91f-43bd-9caa-39ab242b97d5 [Thermothielavioides terrestris]
MAFLFKSKKHQDRGLTSRDGPPVSTPGAGSAAARVRDEKGSRSTPTGSVNSIDNDGSMGSPDQGYPRQRGQSLDQQPQQRPPQMQQQQPGDPQFRNGAPQQLAANPNASLYPWSQRRLTYTSSQPSPFPRYGAAVNSVSSKEGDIYVMGGLINSSTVKGDLWLIEAGTNMACYPLATTAEGPGPRVGHASLLVGNAFIVFGGDTKIEETDILDETLYLLNTSTRQWSRALPAGPRPIGRYGHSLNILGSKIYVFGGQVEGYFMNDLSAFDLNQLQMPNNCWEMLIPSSDSANPPQAKIPPARTNHTMVTFNDKLYLFGGTNGFKWFNDVWCYDPMTNLWSQLDCIGYIPSPREGHAAALVDDVMYIFGGRNEEGADLGDLAAFRITSHRWYTFQNMGPSPSPRSGHSMTTVGKTIVVVGGEPSSAATAVNDLALVYCLDTTKIRYPNDSGANAPRVRRPSDVTAQNVGRSTPSRDGSNGPPDARRQTGAAGAANGYKSPTNEPNPATTVALLKELDAARNRNAWYASELELARKAGYVPSASLSPVLDSRSMDTFDDEDKPLIEALLAMRTELANVQASVDKQAVLAAKQIAEAEKQRDAAIQEAVYAKAKLAARVGGSASSTPQLGSEKDVGDRVDEASRKLAYALNAQKELQDQLDRLSVEYEAERKARKLAEETANATQRRMADLENYKQQNASELERLKSELHLAQREAREQSVAAAEAAATAQMLRLEKAEFEQKYTEAAGSSKEHAETFETLRGAVAASAETKALLERKLDEERALREAVESKLTKLKGEHEARTAELVAATQRLRDAEELAEQYANEARLHREAVMAGLEKISVKDATKSSERGDGERVLALQGQVNAANALVKKYQQEADSAADRLRGAEERIAGLEAYQEQASREGVSIRRQLQNALRETQSLQAANSELKQQLAKQQLEANAMLVQYNALKDILGERGISPTAAMRSRGSPRGGSPEQMRLRELEQQLAAAEAALEETRAQAAVQAQETESTYRDKLAQLDNDYQSTVHYVKGLEKMLKQLNEQLSRYKTENGRLKERVVELEEKLETEDPAAKNGQAPEGWETQQKTLQTEISRLQAELKQTASRLEQQVQSIRQELADTQRERDAAVENAEDAQRRLESSKRDLDQLQQENALLERRAQDAEHKVSTLLDQVELSVDNYRRRSRQAPSLNSESAGFGVSASHPSTGTGANVNGGGNQLHPNNSNNQHYTVPGHMRQDSAASEAESLYGALSGAGGGARNSAALDSLANELETLRSHWEATNKNYRLSNAFDFEAATSTAPAAARNEERAGGGGSGRGLSESLADWRKRLDESHPE